MYDEGARHDTGDYGVLGWLLAGADALSLVNCDDDRLVKLALESLPDPLYSQARECFIEARVHRWAAAVSGQPGGLPERDPRVAHVPEPVEHAGLFLVGDYLFDSTLNGVLESADLATDLLAAALLPEIPAASVASPGRALQGNLGDVPMLKVISTVVATLTGSPRL